MALTREELARKGLDGTLTVREAVEYMQAQPENQALKVTKNSKQRAGRVISGLEQLGLNPDMPYKDLNKFDRVEGMKIVDLLGPSETPVRTNKWGNLQALENFIRPVFNELTITNQTIDVVGEDGQTITKEAMYPQLTGETTGRTQRGGTSSTEDVDVRPMRGTITSQQVDDIYDEALPEVRQNEKYGPKIARLLEYHRMTVNRPAQLWNLKKSDVEMVGNTIIVKGKKVKGGDKKGRPELHWNVNSRGGKLILAALEESESDLLFDVTKTQAENAFKDHVTPRLQPYADKLPLMTFTRPAKKGSNVGELERITKPMDTIGVMRSIVPNYLHAEFKIHQDLVKGVMGHENTETIAKNYTGLPLIPTRDLPLLLDNPADFSSDNYLGDGQGNNIRLSEAQMAELADSRFKILQTKDLAKQQEATNNFLRLIAEQPAYDPAVVQAAGRAAGEAEFLYEQSKKAAYDEKVAQQSVEAELAGNGPQEVVIFSDEQVKTFKQNGMWNDDLQRIQDEAVARRDAASGSPKISKMDVAGDVFDRSIQTGVRGAGAAAAVYDPVGTAIEETIDTIKDKTLGRVVGGGAARKIPGVNLFIPGGFAFPTLSGDYEEADTFAKLFGGTRDDFVNMTPEQLAPYRTAYKQAAEDAKVRESIESKKQVMFELYGVPPEETEASLEGATRGKLGFLRLKN